MNIKENTKEDRVTNETTQNEISMEPLEIQRYEVNWKTTSEQNECGEGNVEKYKPGEEREVCDVH